MFFYLPFQTIQTMLRVASFPDSTPQLFIALCIKADSTPQLFIALCIKAFIHSAIKSWGVESGNEASCVYNQPCFVSCCPAHYLRSARLVHNKCQSQSQLGASLVPRPLHSFHRLQYEKRGRAWERG